MERGTGPRPSGALWLSHSEASHDDRNYAINMYEIKACQFSSAGCELRLDLKRLEAVKHEEFIYLTTIGRKTGKSHTVELWFALAEGKIYLSHEGEYTNWMKNITKNERVAVKIGSLNLEANARVAKQAAARESGKRALYEKYYGKVAKEIIDDWFELSTVLELTPLQDN